MIINPTKNAFSLLEVILAISILSTLTILSAQVMSRALKARTKIQAEVDDVSALRDAMRMIKTDLNMAYHHLDIEKEILDQASKSNGPLRPGTPPASAPKRITKRYDPTTNFIGTDTEVNFVTMNGARMISNTIQADFIEVGYALKSCNNISTQQSSQCLYRRTQNILDEDVKTGGVDMVMLENVSEFKLRYIGESKEDWVNSWNSTSSSSDGGTMYKFPDSVEVTLSIEREIEKKQKTYSMLFVIPIHFPNNAEKSASSGASGSSGGSSGSSSGGSGGSSGGGSSSGGPNGP